MARFGVICSRATAMSVGVCMVVVLGILAPAQAGATYSVTNLITNNQAINPAPVRPRAELGRPGFDLRGIAGRVAAVDDETPVPGDRLIDSHRSR